MACILRFFFHLASKYMVCILNHLSSCIQVHGLHFKPFIILHPSTWHAFLANCVILHPSTWYAFLANCTILHPSTWYAFETFLTILHPSTRYEFHTFFYNFVSKYMVCIRNHSIILHPSTWHAFEAILSSCIQVHGMHLKLFYERARQR